MIKLSTPVNTSGIEMQEPPPHYITKSAIRVDIGKTELRTEEDVNKYVAALKEAMMKEITNNKRITI